MIRALPLLILFLSACTGGPRYGLGLGITPDGVGVFLALLGVVRRRAGVRRGGLGEQRSWIGEAQCPKHVAVTPQSRQTHRVSPFFRIANHRPGARLT